MHRDRHSQRFLLAAVWLLVSIAATACAPDPGDSGGAMPERTAAETALATERATTGSQTAPAETSIPPPHPAPSVGQAWERLPDAPVALTEVAATAHGGRVWIAGGFTADGSASPGVLILEQRDERWTAGPSLPTGVHHAVLVSAGERLYLLGGFIGAGFERPTGEAWTLDEGTDRWEPGPPLPEPRGAGAAAWDGARVVFGGGVGPAGVAADIYALSGDKWERIGELSEPRQHLAAASDGEGRVWFMGGRYSSLETNVGTVEVLSGSGVERGPVDLTPRSGVGAFWADGIGACLAGGEAPSGTLATVECVSEHGEVIDLPPLTVPRHGLGMGVLDDGVYVLLGGEQPGLFVSSVGERLPID